MSVIIPERVARRALERHVVEMTTGCHISTYSTASHGYAQIGWMDKSGRGVVTAHRAAWVAANGHQIPDGMTVDHTCKNKTCVNPDHLRLLSNFENARRTSGRDWPLGECAHGHPNSRLIKRSGRWACRDCSARWQRDYLARKRSREAATKEF